MTFSLLYRMRLLGISLGLEWSAFFSFPHHSPHRSGLNSNFALKGNPLNIVRGNPTSQSFEKTHSRRCLSGPLKVILCKTHWKAGKNLKLCSFKYVYHLLTAALERNRREILSNRAILTLFRDIAPVQRRERRKMWFQLRQDRENRFEWIEMQNVFGISTAAAFLVVPLKYQMQSDKSRRMWKRGDWASQKFFTIATWWKMFSWKRENR